MTDLPQTNLTMVTLVKPEGQLEVSLERRPMPEPKPHEVVVKLLAAPINPSDLGLLFGGLPLVAELSQFQLFEERWQGRIQRRAAGGLHPGVRHSCSGDVQGCRVAAGPQAPAGGAGRSAPAGR